jgi:4-amino-4-deoxy-L-arabinose transferase-like glycosyltransferase
MGILRYHFFDLFLVCAITCAVAFAVFLKATFFSAYWSYVPVPATFVYICIFVLCGTLAARIMWRTRNIRTALGKLLIATAPAILLLSSTIIARSLELTVIKTQYNEFDIIVVLWFLVFGAYHIWTYFATTQSSTRSTPTSQTNLYTLHTVVLLLFFAGLFIFFGTRSLGNAAYVDERLWTYSTEKRIEKYWNNIAERDWAHTRPSDKPGVTLALLSGPSLLFVTPSDFAGDTIVHKGDFAHMLFVMRLPLVLFAACMLLLFYHLTATLLAPRTGLLATGFIALSPLLIGMSRIINPDALSWLFMPLTLLAYLCFHNTQRFRYLMLTGILLGMGLLTKYIANLLILFFIAMLFSSMFFGTQKQRERIRDTVRAHTATLTLIVLIALMTFTLLFPGVWVRADRLLIGTIWSQPFVPIWQGFVALLLFLFWDYYWNRSRALTTLVAHVQRIGVYIRPAVPLALLCGACAVLFLVLSGSVLVDFETILSSPKTTVALSVLGVLHVYLAGLYAAVFGVHPFVLCGFLIALYALLRSKLSPRIQHTLWHLLFFILLYYIGSIISAVVPTVRYQIIIYPLIFIIAACGWLWFIDTFFARARVFVYWLCTAAATILLLFSLHTLAPFYFSYNSTLLPQEHIIAPKDMGDGSYDIAQFLNALPHAQDLNVWSDKNGVCTFFVGRCSGNIRKSDFIAYGPDYDYYVISRGRAARTTTLSRAYAQGRTDYPVRLDTLYADTQHPIFEITPGNRTTNYIRVFAREDVAVWRGAENTQ